jgi:putative transposase
MLVDIPPQIAVSDFVRRVNGHSSHRARMEFPDLRKRTWGRHFWARGYFSTTSCNITDEVIVSSFGSTNLPASADSNSVH